MRNAHDLFTGLFVGSVLIGIIGFSAMTWFFPLCARLLAPLLRRLCGHSLAKTAEAPVRRIAILIPAHNEERTLTETLPSMLSAIRHLQARHPKVQVDIRVGADGCKDRTVELARSHGAEVMDSPVSRGKWRTVHELIRNASDADWIVLSDAGILWPENFITECLSVMNMPGVMGVAPTYRNPTQGLVEKIIWGMEAFLKTMENAAGGTISVHGPTVMYRRRELLGAFDALSASGTTWINDDVAVSLYLRLNHPESRIVYVPSVGSWDCAASHLEASGAPIREFNRRKRMVLGNLQWIKMILVPNWDKNPLAAFVSLRRVFRIIWIYWILAFGVAFVLMSALAFGLGYFLVLALASSILVVRILGARPIQMLMDSGFVSFLAPYYLVSGQGLSRWK
jgi:cellulose synthase/poly-beta-1,6-N-acetylglucosamine synthase-like glycosyltransferase